MLFRSGQLTSSAIEDINSKQLGKIRRHLENESADSKCATLSQEILTGKTPMKAQASLSCERISIENGNPLLNMIYTMAYFKQSRSMIQNRILNDSRFKSVLALSQNDLELLDSELGVWSHNAGAGGITKPTIALLNEYAMQGEKVTDVKKFLSELELFAFEMPHPANRSHARRLETSTYYKKIQSTAQNIEKSVGVRSCLNQ